jgi:hypothetical protein
VKDLGLRTLLRWFAAVPPAEAHGLIVLTSRLAITDIARWKDGTAPVVDVEELSDEAIDLVDHHGVDIAGPLRIGLLRQRLPARRCGRARA